MKLLALAKTVRGNTDVKLVLLQKEQPKSSVEIDKLLVRLRNEVEDSPTLTELEKHAKFVGVNVMFSAFHAMLENNEMQCFFSLFVYFGKSPPQYENADIHFTIKLRKRKTDAQEIELTAVFSDIQVSMLGGTNGLIESTIPTNNQVLTLYLKESVMKETGSLARALATLILGFVSQHFARILSVLRFTAKRGGATW